MKIANIQGLTPQQIRDEINNGGQFVYFPYTVSIVLATFKRSSDIYLVRSGEGKFKYSATSTLANVFLGWWGIPWGPIYTIGSLYSCLSGGKDVTNEVMSSINQQDPNYMTGNTYNLPGQPQSSAGNNETGSQYNIPK